MLTRAINIRTPPRSRKQKRWRKYLFLEAYLCYVFLMGRDSETQRARHSQLCLYEKADQELMADLVQYYGTGRRKTAVARVFLRPGSGEFKVNGRPFEQYFVTESQRASAKVPLVSTESVVTFNVIANVSGGGINGQADAVKLGIARALMLFNAELRKKLKAEGLVSRDSRSKERKKYGQKGARKRFQFSKR